MTKQGARKRVFLLSHHLILRPLFVCPGKLMSIDASLEKKKHIFQENKLPGDAFPRALFFMPRRNFGGILKSNRLSVHPSVRPSVSPSVTNRVSAISHKLLKQI